MKWSRNLGTLRRSISLAARIAKSQVTTARSPPQQPPGTGRLVNFSGFGDNPGRLRMLVHLPPDVAGQPLVVLLHGCGQNAATFAVDSGWSELADRLRFPLILPEQLEANNPARCFQWFRPSDTARDAGEAGSIAAMTRAAVERFDTDPRRVFIVGLSAGGAMAACLLASYPELYAAGASVAGLPVGTAQSGVQAILRMASAGKGHSPQQMAARVRGAAQPGFTGPWPRMSIWHGEADDTVAPDNADLLAEQWRAVHGLIDTPAEEQVHHGVRHRSWSSRDGCQVEQWSLPTLGHGYPVGARPTPAGHFTLRAPIDATQAIAQFFALNEKRRR